jgi:hypothetical protein
MWSGASKVPVQNRLVKIYSAQLFQKCRAMLNLNLCFGSHKRSEESVKFSILSQFLNRQIVLSSHVETKALQSS